MLIIETVQVVFVVAVLVLATEKHVANPLLFWTATGFATSQVLSGLDGNLTDGFLRLFVAVFATLVIDEWRTRRAVTPWTAGPAALLSGLLIGWVA
ncbi:hypothetical protein [Streptomyces hilarionis]|uniref:hypothetical protein n=1 Tax=Streptomyces hilarionis TaxID=2839954 RepID=UPI002119E117|nr:hypothetical protein [Streptomyces hilarionis]MCQ9132290.1 hypothetical protein [Streptomyces hilarionis]